MNDLGIGEDLGDVIDRPRRHARIFECRKQGRAVPGGKTRAERGDQRLARRHPACIVRKSRIGGKVFGLQYGAEGTELRIGSDGDHHRPVLHAEELVRYDIGMV